MLDSNDTSEILKNIELLGSSDKSEAKLNVVIADKDIAHSHILNMSSGKVQIRRSLTTRFSLILSQPGIVSALSPFDIRCCLCRKVINYPAWYLRMNYSINIFHFFVCFDSNEINKVTSNCFRGL